MKHYSIISFLILLQAASPALGNGLSESIASKTVGSAGDVKADAKTDTSGREYKAGDAQKQGNTGAGTAIATGAALIAAAIPLLASMEPVQIAAGADLMAKAGLEFGQAGADAKSAAKNKAQKELLTNKNAAGETGSQDTAKNSIQSPALDQLLADRGINADDFKNRLANGEITSPQDVLGSLGNITPISSDDFAAGANLANMETGKIFNPGENSKGAAESAAVGFDEHNGETSPQGEGESSDTSFASSSGSTGTEHQGVGQSSADAIKQTVLGLKHSTAGGGNAVAKETSSGAQSENNYDVSALVKNLFGSSPGAATLDQAQGLMRIGLERMGIIAPKAKQNIFQLARRNYFSFGKWRKTVRVATTH